MAGSQWVATLVNVPTRTLPAASVCSSSAVWCSSRSSDGADVGHEALALRRQPCAGAGALQERQTQLRFHRGHNVADAGLGEAQFLRRLGQRRPLHDFFDNSILFCVHFVNLPLAFLNAWCYDTPIHSKYL